jgi:H+/gluconate symporter-like permease
MAKILSYKNNRDKFLVIVLLIISIVITNSFIIFSPDEDSRFYFSGITSTLALGVALVISIVMVYKYKRSIKKQEEKQPALSQKSNDTKLHHYYYDNNKIHFSICLFFAFWLAASVNWTFEDQEAPGVLIADILYYLGYASFGYFLYSLYYHFFRKEFEPFILILIALIILVPLIFIVDTIVSTLRLLSTQTIDISLVIVNASYPILDAILIFPIAIMYWAVRRINSRRKDATLNEQQKIKEKEKLSSSFVSSDASMWILLLFIAMVLSAAGDSGFAYTSAFDVTTVQNYIWMWNILYNSDHLCLAAALIGYKHFFTFSKLDV